MTRDSPVTPSGPARTVASAVGVWVCGFPRSHTHTHTHTRTPHTPAHRGAHPYRTPTRTVTRIVMTPFRGRTYRSDSDLFRSQPADMLLACSLPPGTQGRSQGRLPPGRRPSTVAPAVRRRRPVSTRPMFAIRGSRSISAGRRSGRRRPVSTRRLDPATPWDDERFGRAIPWGDSIGRSKSDDFIGQSKSGDFIGRSALGEGPLPAVATRAEKRRSANNNNNNK